MKMMKEWLTLLLAGVLLTSLMTACGSDNSGDGGKGTDSEKQSEQTTLGPNGENPDVDIKVEGLLSPSEFAEAIYGDADMTVNYQLEDESGSEVKVFERDGNKVKETYERIITYYDFGEGKEYIKDETAGEEDPWDKKDSSWKNWKDLVESTIIGNGNEMLYADENYELKDGRYTVKESFITDIMAQSQMEGKVELFFEYKDGANIFYCKIETADGQLLTEEIISVTFGDTAVELPTSIRGSEEWREFTPADLYASIMSGKGATGYVSHQLIMNDQYSVERLEYRYDGDKLWYRNNIENDNIEYEAYFDFGEGLEYYEDEEGWQTQAAAYDDWNTLVQEFFVGVDLEVLFDDNCYTERDDGAHWMNMEDTEAILEDWTKEEGFSEIFGDMPMLAIRIDCNNYIWDITIELSAGDIMKNFKSTCSFHFGDETVELPELAG